ncbi:proline-specific peptidase [Heliocybe sulcata]|uniref:Proline-specific peptidase n=1 Tax=Heliocybe sulcata TaxID=5364 RepID=A0A5C3MY78_9AGAM|nr:proline-specific peptidase [Heliocybe sulcata]
MPTPYLTEGRIPFKVGDETFETYYKLAGDIASSPRPPCVVLHGGPGISHDYLVPMADLAAPPNCIPMVFYDQLGNGRSTILPHKSTLFWTIDLLLDELENLLAHLRISGHYDLIGHSWGAMLASEFIIRRQPKGLLRLVLTNGHVSSPLRSRVMKELRARLPEDVRACMKKHEAAGTTDSDEYRATEDVFYATFACRVKPMPSEVTHPLSLARTNPSPRANEGLADKWDIRDKLHMMRHVPALLINGEYDYMTDEICGPWFWAMDKIKWYKFANASHMPWWEEREKYMAVVGEFLTRVE